MKRTVPLMLTLAALVVLAGSAAADGIDRREARQHSRIRQGWVSGELTPREALRLRRGQMRVRQLELAARADGFVSPRERAVIRRAQLRQSWMIFRLKHNSRSV